MNVGSDGVQACASSFQSGADPRSKNQVTRLLHADGADLSYGPEANAQLSQRFR